MAGVRIMVAIVFIALLATCEGGMPFKEQCLYWHNYFRKLHQVPPVTWSSSLQKEAEDWVKYLAENNKFEHSPHNPGNLYLARYRPDEYCSDAIWWFHQEEQFYNYSSPGFLIAAGHFTQVGHIQNNSQLASETGRMKKRIKRSFGEIQNVLEQHGQFGKMGAL
ncbi:Golgi-associated plant pathogenesis-related protein 1-like isoform X3 [Montipora capricornis]|uniref:Golgi-associated plant pathogenesis-related protein 1-like isoform X3 n=1 Tax=Montipora capricornis TaxID=246305 RepID=UPI0035F11A7E